MILDVYDQVHTEGEHADGSDESAVSALLDALRVGEGTDLVRELAQWALQALIEAEATAAIGADPWECTGDRVTHRNGHRPRVLSTKALGVDIGDSEDEHLVDSGPHRQFVGDDSGGGEGGPAPGPDRSSSDSASSPNQ